MGTTHNKTFKYNFWTDTPKSSNQNTVFIGYDFLIGWYSNKSSNSYSKVLWLWGQIFFIIDI